jgi:galactonate dehydratase
MRKTNTRRSFLAKSALAGAAFQPLAAFGQAVQNTITASSPSALRITDLKCGYVRGSLYGKLHTNQGIWGCGEAVDAVVGTYYMVQNFGRAMSSARRTSSHRDSGRRHRAGPIRSRCASAT